MYKLGKLECAKVRCESMTSIKMDLKMKNRIMVKVMTFSVLLLTLGCQQPSTDESKEAAQKQLDENKENKRIVLDFLQLTSTFLLSISNIIPLLRMGQQRLSSLRQSGLKGSLRQRLMYSILLRTATWSSYT